MEKNNETKEVFMSRTEEKVTIGIIIMEIFIGLLALLTIFLPAVVTSSDSYEGIYTTFGGGSNGGIITQFFKFSFGNFLAYLLVVAAMVLGFVRLAVPRIDMFVTRCITAGLFFVAGILFILNKQMTVMNVNVNKDIFKLGFGPLLGMIACIVDILIVGVDIWFSNKIGTIGHDEDNATAQPLTEEELRAQVLAEIEAEKKMSEEKDSE